MKLIKIGRGNENDIVLNDDLNISRNHAEIFQDDDKNIFLTDLDSANGTFINGKKLKGSEILKSNDIVKIGKTVLPWKNYIKVENKKNEIRIDKTNEKPNQLELQKEENIDTEQKNYKQGFFYKYFTYNGEYISGSTYWWRMFFNSWLIAFFGLGFYLMGLTVYKRSKSFKMDNTVAFIASVIIPSLAIIASLTEEIAIRILLLIPHLIYIFKNGKKHQHEAS